MNPATTRTVFRALAVAEAVSWALLLLAMFCKWILESEPFGLAEGGVPVAGPIHGGVFVLYVLASLVSSRVFGWSLRTTHAAWHETGVELRPAHAWLLHHVAAGTRRLRDRGHRSGCLSLRLHLRLGLRPHGRRLHRPGCAAALAKWLRGRLG